MKRIVKPLLFLSAMLPLAGHAQIIMCKDAAGRTYSSDRPIMECSGRAIREYGRNGVLRREIPAPLTAEQKRQKQQEEEKHKEEQAALEAQKQADRALLARYGKESDIEAARKRTLEPAHEQLKRQTDSVVAAEKQQRQVQSEIAQAKNPNAVPPELARRLEEAGKTVQDQTKRAREIEAEIAQINQKFDGALKRFRELNGHQQTASK